jgi:plasmid rolling circle replication initiator protein Rep
MSPSPVALGEQDNFCSEQTYFKLRVEKREGRVIAKRHRKALGLLK